MRVRQGSVLEALRRAKQFLDANSRLFEAVNKSSARRILDEVVAQLVAHGLRQDQSGNGSVAETARQRTLRVALRFDYMRPIAAVARRRLRAVPEFMALRMPRGNLMVEPLVVAARGMAMAAKRHAEVLIDNGLQEDFIEQLTAATKELESSIDERNVLRIARVGSTAGLAAEEGRGRTILRILDSAVCPKLRDNPMLLAEWKAMRQVKRGRPAPARLSPEASQRGSLTEPSTSVEGRGGMRDVGSQSKGGRFGPAVWVVRNGTGYVAKEAGVRIPFTAVTTQAEAIVKARAAARRNRSELIVQGRGGRIRMKTSYGPDPRSRHG